MRFFLFCLLCFFCGITHVVHAQVSSDFSHIVPASPQAAALQRAVKVPVDYSTGVPNISIPIFDIQSGAISVPVSLNYHASGIQVDQVATAVGLGWSLSAGGAVLRTIRDKVDNPNTFKITNHFIDSINQVNTFSSHEYLKGDDDFTQDDYSYNFLNYSGSFYFDSNQVIHPIIRDQLKIESSDGYLSSFIARDRAGNTYTFDHTDNSTLRTWSTNIGIANVTDGVTAWHLSSIQNQQVGLVTFNYEGYQNTYQFLTTDIADVKKEHLFNSYPGETGASPCIASDWPTTVYQLMAQHGFQGSVVKQIIARDVRADFYYSIDSTAAYYQKRLDSVTLTSLIDNKVKKRVYLSYVLFNGNSQLKLVKVIKKDVNTGATEETKFDYYEDASYPLPQMGSRSRDIFGYFNGKTNTFLIQTTDPDYVYGSADRATNPQTIVLGTLKRITYPTGGFTQFSYEPNQLGPTSFAAGIRIREQDDYNPSDDRLNRTTYEYYNFAGTGTYYPINMAPEIRIGKWKRKFFSSSGLSMSFLTAYAPVVPHGYMYDSVVVKRKGDGYDLVESNKYTGVWIFDVLHAYPIRVDQYKYNSASKSYSVIQRKKTTYSIWSTPENVTVLTSRIPIVYTTVNYSDGSMAPCVYNCPGLTSGTSLTENAMLKTKEETIAYDGTRELNTTTCYYYGNMDHMQPTRIVRLNSKDSLVTTIKYPAEMVSGGFDPTGVFQAMLVRHLWANKAIEENFDAQGNSLSKTVTTYRNNWLPLDFIAEETIQQGFKGHMPQIRKQIHYYDLNGNIVEYSEDGLHTALIWDNNNSVPIAKTSNAGTGDIAFAGFETSVNGGWSLAGSIYSNTAFTGKRSYSLSSGAITRTINTGVSYIVSYWAKNGSSVIVNGASGTAGDIKNGWTYREHKISGQSSVTILGSGYIDDLRIYPANALMTTYAYEPSVGVTSISDASGKTTFYEYDGMQRLSLIRDADSNIIKKIVYHYVQPGTMVPPFHSSATSGTFYSNTCPVGQYPLSYEYTVEDDRYPSFISYAAAQDQASKEVIERGQNYADRYGGCTVTPPCPNCTGLFKCINGICKHGNIVYTASVYNPGTGKYECTFHYEWPDGSRSGDLINLVNDAPCL